MQGLGFRVRGLVSCKKGFRVCLILDDIVENMLVEMKNQNGEDRYMETTICLFRVGVLFEGDGMGNFLQCRTVLAFLETQFS